MKRGENSKELPEASSKAAIEEKEEPTSKLALGDEDFDQSAIIAEDPSLYFVSRSAPQCELISKNIAKEYSPAILPAAKLSPRKPKAIDSPLVDKNLHVYSGGEDINLEEIDAKSFKSNSTTQKQKTMQN
jgi:hypothetical protein